LNGEGTQVKAVALDVILVDARERAALTRPFRAVVIPIHARQVALLDHLLFLYLLTILEVT